MIVVFAMNELGLLDLLLVLPLLLWVVVSLDYVVVLVVFLHFLSYLVLFLPSQSHFSLFIVPPELRLYDIKL